MLKRFYTAIVHRRRAVLAAFEMCIRDRPCAAAGLLPTGSWKTSPPTPCRSSPTGLPRRKNRWKKPTLRPGRTCLLYTSYLEEARNKQNVEDIYMLLTDVPKEESVVISDGR